jgi:hypothetical protein
MIRRRTHFFRFPYIGAPRGLKSSEDNSAERGGGGNVVKGTARRVIVVDSPDPTVFEQAIFVVREDYLRTPGISQKELLRQARAAAGSYLGKISGKKRGVWRRFPAASLAAAGAAATGLAYVVLRMAGIY